MVMLSQGMLLCVHPPRDASTSVTECPHPINSPVWPRSPPPVCGRARPRVPGWAQGSRVLGAGCFPAGRRRGQLAAAGLEQRGLF